MTTEIYIYEDTDWEKLMHRMCVCGHELYMHAFTQHPNLSFDVDGNLHTNSGSVLWISQCISCPYNHEKQKYVCDEFRYAQ